MSCNHENCRLQPDDMLGKCTCGDCGEKVDIDDAINAKLAKVDRFLKEAELRVMATMYPPASFVNPFNKPEYGPSALTPPDETVEKSEKHPHVPPLRGPDCNFPENPDKCNHLWPEILNPFHRLYVFCGKCGQKGMWKHGQYIPVDSKLVLKPGPSTLAPPDEYEGIVCPKCKTTWASGRLFRRGDPSEAPSFYTCTNCKLTFGLNFQLHGAMPCEAGWVAAQKGSLAWAIAMLQEGKKIAIQPDYYADEVESIKLKGNYRIFEITGNAISEDDWELYEEARR